MQAMKNHFFQKVPLMLRLLAKENNLRFENSLNIGAKW